MQKLLASERLEMQNLLDNDRKLSQLAQQEKEAHLDLLRVKMVIIEKQLHL
jgi:hypothetical protein